MEKRIATIITCLMAAVAVMAQKYTMSGDVPEQVIHKGDKFHLSYKFNSTDIRDFKLGAMPSAFKVLIGPSQSYSSSSVFSGGRTTRQEQMTFTYVLFADQEGTFTIPSATAIVGGQTLKSEPLTVTVVGREEPGKSPTMTSENIFISVSASKRHVVLNEPLLLTFKVCWHPDLRVDNLDGIDLKVQDAYVQPYNNTQKKSVEMERINGRNLVTIKWEQFVVYPQKTGKLHIPSLSMTAYINERVLLDAFTGFYTTQQVPKPLTTQPFDIEVDELPERPADFSGGVGKFSIKAELDKTELKENTPVTMTVTVSGRGNLNMLNAPIVNFPKYFDTYDTKQNDEYRLTDRGLDGKVTYEFLAVPQKKGSYTIPPAQLTYYDLEARQYRTVATDSFHIEVLKGDGTSSSLHDYTTMRGAEVSDIRPIRTGKDRSPSSQAFFASALYFTLLAAILLAFIILFVILRYREYGMANEEKSKGRRANKVAVRKLRKAAKLMRDGKPGEFYDETLRALWGYVGDKLNIPVSQLSRENISQRLAEQNVDGATTATFIEAIDECEFVRYAPGDQQGNMNKVYEKSITAIENIESVKKTKTKTKTGAGAAISILFAIALVSTPTVSAQTKIQADEAYTQEEYEEAVELYRQVIAKSGASADVYYNMGNAYYRQDSIAQAILAWERALRIQPGYDDARFNLQLAQSKTVDNIAAEREMFFVTWYRSLVNALSVDVWAYIALAALAVALLLLLVYLFAFEERLRRLSFYGASVLGAAFCLATLFAWQQKRALGSHDAAIVMVEELQVKKIPDDGGSVEFTIHEGTKVNIADDTMSGWTQITLPDGREGWVSREGLETI